MSVSFCFTDSVIRKKTGAGAKSGFQFMIETERLLLRPLTAGQLRKFLRNDFSLEEELGLKIGDQILSPELKSAIEKTILPAVGESGKDPLFSTLWIAISKHEQNIVGGLAFKGEPNAKGEIELGYGIYEAHQQKGFMSEMLASIISWVKTRQSVVAITAQSFKKNVASSKVLVKNGFEINGMDDEFFHWVLPLNGIRSWH